MKISPLPENEEKRLETIQRYHILDTEYEDDFDGIVELASQLCDTPITLITLIDRNRQWFKAKSGLNIRETHRNLSFCAHAIHKNDIMIVTDALQDERFFDNPLVTGDPHIRFYAGMPLIANEDIKLGTLAVIDRKPRDLNAKQLKDLQILGNQVVNLLNQRYTIALLQKTNQEITRLVDEKTVEIRDVFERVSDAFMAVDKNWSITFMNEKAAQITNRSRKDIIGKNLWKEFPEAFSSIFPKIAEAAMITQQYQYQEAYFQPYDRWLESHIYPSPSGLSIYFRDITERKKAEFALRKSEDKLRAFFRSTSDGSVLLGKNFEILAFNSAANELVENTYNRGIKEGELYTDLIFPKVRSLITEYIQKALNGETSQGEFSIPNIKTGKNMWWLASFMPAYDNDGNIFGVVANSTNIHKIKKAELKLKNQFKELQKTNQELDRFVYSVSHDLRAPLATILGLLNIAEMEDTAPAFKNYLAMIRSSINRLDGFIKDILDYSQNARKEIQIEPINFQELITESQNNLTLISGADRLKTKIEIENTVAFNSDRIRIGVLLNNLFSNAIKYQDYSKELSIVSIRIITSAENAFIKFSDNGIGIEAKHLPKIFEMFYRASENSQGSGLGLYIAKEVIAKLGGTVKVESEFGVSTTFEIVIPNSCLGLMTKNN